MFLTTCAKPEEPDISSDPVLFHQTERSKIIIPATLTGLQSTPCIDWNHPENSPRALVHTNHAHAHSCSSCSCEARENAATTAAAWVAFVIRRSSLSATSAPLFPLRLLFLVLPNIRSRYCIPAMLDSVLETKEGQQKDKNSSGVISRPQLHMFPSTACLLCPAVYCAVYVRVVAVLVWTWPDFDDRSFFCQRRAPRWEADRNGFDGTPEEREGKPRFTDVMYVSVRGLNTETAAVNGLREGGVAEQVGGGGGWSGGWGGREGGKDGLITRTEKNNLGQQICLNIDFFCKPVVCRVIHPVRSPALLACSHRAQPDRDLRSLPNTSPHSLADRLLPTSQPAHLFPPHTLPLPISIIPQPEDSLCPTPTALSKLMQPPPPPPPPPPQPPQPTPPSYGVPLPSPNYVESESWWNRSVQVVLIDIIYAAFTTVLNFNPDALFKSSKESKESEPNPAVEALLRHPQCDAAVKMAYDLLHRSIPERVPPPDLKSDLWQHNKEKIVMLVVHMCERDRSGTGLPRINHGYIPKKDIVWGAFLPPVNPHDTPARTLPPAEELARQAPMSMPTPAESDIGTPRNPDMHNSNNTNAFSPGETVLSPAPSAARRRRSESANAMTDDARSPKRPRARGPQEHACPNCAKTFPFQSKLKDHMRIHESNKTFQCPICHKGFKRSREVTAHTKAVHKTTLPPGGAGSSLSPDLQSREISIQPRPHTALQVGGSLQLRPAESAAQALLSMPTPGAESPSAVKHEPIDPQIQQLSNAAAAAAAAMQDGNTTTRIDADGRPIVKPMYHQQSEPTTTGAEFPAPTAPTAPMAVNEENGKDNSNANSNSTSPQPTATSERPAAKPLAPDIPSGEEKQGAGEGKGDGKGSPEIRIPSPDNDPNIEKYITGESIFNAGTQ
ncbi:hypothetical protein EX30DRAFT_349770 [Ascodesmis nigricans]|uniref:C2H2-type domain-containing protein n=1 Tax=Ascodesmis nigricans TaxID=341454 RepID=A0A4S2MU24_9PEZI|nr:hypothetical protein EX30DRAFT_349770 [Ascodesmis nigricans]